MSFLHKSKSPFLHKSKSPFLMVSLMLLDLDTIFWTIRSKGATNFDAMLNTEASHFSNVSSVGKQSCKSHIKHDHINRRGRSYGGKEEEEEEDERVMQNKSKIKKGPILQTSQ
ncbi:hypothetical protein Peur_012033 [Populus x canadensis]